MQTKAVSSPHLLQILSLFEVSAHKKNRDDVELKDRDIKILGLVAKGLTNAQIAEQMFLSPESVKKYLYDIFRDLEVKNRMNAVLKARELGLIK
jgi:LuxR family transcriptional regulator, maltose regulon positive regulatory protein